MNVDRFLSITLTIASVVIAAVLVRAQYHRAEPPTGRVQSAFVAAWRDVEPIGVALGNTKAPIKIVEFADLECPVCRAYHPVLRSVQEQRPNTVEVLFVHFPLAMHRFALPSARAAECADRAGRFGAYVDALYAKQDSLGLRSWAAFAADAGVMDTAAIQRCALDGTTPPRVTAGLALGQRFHVEGTPTILVNGWRFDGAVLNVTQLMRLVDAFEHGRLSEHSPTEAVNRVVEDN